MQDINKTLKFSVNISPKNIQYKTDKNKCREEKKTPNKRTKTHTRQVNNDHINKDRVGEKPIYTQRDRCAWSGWLLVTQVIAVSRESDDCRDQQEEKAEQN